MSGFRAHRPAIAPGLACLAGVLLVVSDAGAQATVRSSIAATQLEVGRPVEWVVSTSGLSGNDAPAIPPFDWATVQEMGTEQNFAWVNGRTSMRTIHRYRLVPLTAGSFQVPAVTVRAGGRAHVTDPIAVTVLPAQGGLGIDETGSAGDPRLRLVAEATPRTVVVGEPVVLAMKLFQGVRLLSAPQYSPPATPRFYSEKSGPVHSEYVTANGQRWILGETRTVLYPTVSGKLTIGPARFLCILADRDAMGGVDVEVVSRAVSVDVRPLPPAPAGFGGAVADARLTGALDRTRIRADEAVQLTFRLAGRGNLRLAPPPTLPEAPDFQVFDRRIEDSLNVESGYPEGSKIVRYALLPRRTGPLQLPAMSYVTYVPGEGYRTLTWPGATVDVVPGLARGGPPTPGATRAARLVPVRDPGGAPWTAARPYVGAAAVLFAAALWLARLRLRPRRAPAADADGNGFEGGDTGTVSPPDPAAQARLAREGATRLAAHRASLAAARARGDAAAFWRGAEEALAALGGAGDAELRSRVAAARYAPGGGAAAAMDALAGPLEARLAAAEQAARATGRVKVPRAARIGAAVLALLAVVALVLGGIAVATPPDDASLRRTLATAADELAANRVPQAQARLLDAWNAGARRPGVAIDLALAAWYDRRLGETALWTERARRLDPRHPLVGALVDALREEGAWEGLPTGARARTTAGEIVFAACLVVALALVVFVAGRRHGAARWAGRALVVIAIGLAIHASLSGAAGEAPGRAVVLRAVTLAPAPGQPGDVELEPGRALWLDGSAARGWTKVKLGSQVHGVVPANAVRAL